MEAGAEKNMNDKPPPKPCRICGGTDIATGRLLEWAIRGTPVCKVCFYAFLDKRSEIRLNRAASPSRFNSLYGRVVEVGDLDALGGKPGIIIETTREQLRDCCRNLAFAEVVVGVANARLHRPPGAAGEGGTQ